MKLEWLLIRQVHNIIKHYYYYYYYIYKDYSDAIARTLQGHFTIVTELQ